MDGTDDLKAKVASHLGIAVDSPEVSGMEWLGLFSTDPLPGPTAPVDILTQRMLEKMSYNEGERDLLVLQHTFVAEYPGKKEHITSTMIAGAATTGVAMLVPLSLKKYGKMPVFPELS